MMLCMVLLPHAAIFKTSPNQALSVLGTYIKSSTSSCLSLGELALSLTPEADTQRHFSNSSSSTLHAACHFLWFILSPHTFSMTTRLWPWIQESLCTLAPIAHYLGTLYTTVSFQQPVSQCFFFFFSTSTIFIQSVLYAIIYKVSEAHHFP